MTDNLTIYKQIYPTQCAKIAELGYRSVINIRPDDEHITQPSSQELATATKQANLAYHHLPFDDERLSLLTVEQFATYYHAFQLFLSFCNINRSVISHFEPPLFQTVF